MPGTNGVPTGMSGREVKSGGGRRSGGGGGGGGDEEGRASSRKGADQRNSAHRGGGAAQRHPTEARQVTPQKFYFFPRPTRGHNQIPLLLMLNMFFCPHTDMYGPQARLFTECQHPEA